MLAITQIKAGNLLVQYVYYRYFYRLYNQKSFKWFYFHPTFTDLKEQQQIIDSYKVYYDFINEEEEKMLENEIEPVVKKLRYELDHWDAAILGYRETEKKLWKLENSRILRRVRDIAFSNGEAMPLVHILDLKEEGVIKPHIDSIKFCGSTIAGLSLLSDSVMRLAREGRPECTVDVFLPRRSLYIMTGPSRYEYTHAVLGGAESVFDNLPVAKSRRISVILRNEPGCV